MDSRKENVLFIPSRTFETWWLTLEKARRTIAKSLMISLAQVERLSAPSRYWQFRIILLLKCVLLLKNGKYHSQI